MIVLVSETDTVTQGVAAALQEPLDPCIPAEVKADVIAMGLMEGQVPIFASQPGKRKFNPVEDVNASLVSQACIARPCNPLPRRH